MDPDSHDNKNSIITLPQFGKVALNPKIAREEDYNEVKLVIFSKKMSDEQFKVACEWAARTQTPIYCLQVDVARLYQEGFYEYRFQILKHYQRFRMRAGVLEFFPIEKKKKILFFYVKAFPEIFHVLFRPDENAPIMILGDSQISVDDAHVFKSFNANFYRDSYGPKEDWTKAEALLESKIKLIEFTEEKAGGNNFWKTKTIIQKPTNKEFGQESSQALEVKNG